VSVSFVRSSFDQSLVPTIRCLTPDLEEEGIQYAYKRSFYRLGPSNGNTQADTQLQREEGHAHTHTHTHNTIELQV